MDPRGRVAVMTGASSGIGLAVAQHLARAGAAVVLGARRADKLDEAVAKIRGEGGRAEAVTMDVTSETDVARLVSHAETTFGGLHIVVCNAGFGFYGTVEETPPDVMRRMMEVNFIGTYLTARAALPIFRRQASGHLMIVSSIVGQRGIPAMSAYGATKAAQVGLRRIAPHRVRRHGHRSQHRLPGVDANRIPLRDEPGLRPLGGRTRTEADGGRRGAGRWSMAFDGRGRRFIPMCRRAASSF